MNINERNRFTRVGMFWFIFAILKRCFMAGYDNGLGETETFCISSEVV